MSTVAECEPKITAKRLRPGSSLLRISSRVGGELRHVHTLDIANAYAREEYASVLRRLFPHANGIDERLLAFAEQTITPAETAAEWNPFPVNLLPLAVRKYVHETAEGMSSDPAMVALPMLAGLAAAIGNTRTIMLKSDWEEPAIIWAAIVADSGSYKTPAMRKALMFINERERDIEQQNAEALAGYEAERTVHECAVATWKQQSRRLGDEAGLPPAAPRHPGRTALVVSDATVEAVGQVLGENPRGVLLERDELAGWLAGFDRYKSGGAGRVSSEVGHWLSMHNAGSLRFNRKSTGRVFVPRATLSIIGGIQPDTLTQAIGQEHVANGLIARFLLAAPPRRPKRFSTNTATFESIDSARRLFTTLYSIPQLENPMALPLARDGEAAYQDFYERNAARQEVASGVLASMLAKIEAAAARLALIIHVCRQAAEDPTLPNAVDADSIAAGVGLAEWFAAEWQRVYEITIGGAKPGDRDKDLLHWISSQGGEVAARDIGQRLRRYRDSDTLEQAINRLVQAGKLRTFHEQNEKGGPPALWVRLQGQDQPGSDAGHGT